MVTGTLLRVIIADDHNLALTGIKNMLDDSRFAVAGAARNGKELFGMYLKLQPDLILTDISMPELSGIEAVKLIRQRDKNAKVLFISMYDNTETLRRCINAGGLGLIGKDTVKDELNNAMLEVHNGSYYFRKKLNQDELNSLLDGDTKEPEAPLNLYLLTKKELQVFESYGEGMTTEEISGLMNITKHTCVTHRKSLMLKLGLTSFPHLIRRSVMHLHQCGKI